MFLASSYILSLSHFVKIVELLDLSFLRTLLFLLTTSISLCSLLWSFNVGLRVLLIV